MGFPGDSDSQESACGAKDLDLTPGLGKSPGEGNGQINKDRKIGDLLGPGGIRQLESMGLLLEMMKMF